MQEMYDLNCKRLDAIIDCVVLCERQNIAFRGHKDDNSQADGQNKGNFKAILEFRAEGDQVLLKHLAEGPKYAQYTSPETQNEIISICKSLILKKMSADVKENYTYSIICDECTNSSNKEQLSLSIRFVKDDKVHESFMEFYELAEVQLRQH